MYWMCFPLRIISVQAELGSKEFIHALHTQSLTIWSYYLVAVLSLALYALNHYCLIRSRYLLFM